MGLSLSNIASTYEFLKQPKKAIASYLEAIRLQSLIGDLRVKAIAMSNLASICIEIKKYDTAFILIQQSLKIREQLGNPDNIALSHLILSQYYKNINDSQKSFESALKAYEFAAKYKTTEIVKRCAEALYKISEERGDKASAFTYFKEFI